MRRVFVCFLEEIEDSKKAFWNYLVFSRGAYFLKNIFMWKVSLFINQVCYFIFSWKITHGFETETPLNAFHENIVVDCFDNIQFLIKSSLKKHSYSYVTAFSQEKTSEDLVKSETNCNVTLSSQDKNDSLEILPTYYFLL